MSAGAVAGALLGLAVGLGYLLWVRQRVRAPLPTEPHPFDPDEGVRFLGTARVAGTTVAWPRGELVADREAILVRAPRPGAASGAGESADVLLVRSKVRLLSVAGGRMSRRVSFDVAGAEKPPTFGAALADPAPALRSLGWPVDER